MIYQVYSDANLIYDSGIESLKLTKAQLELEVNKAGSFTFTMYPSHPQYNSIQRLKSIITVYQDGLLIFRGRLLDDAKGFYNEMQATCEGELAFLNDSIQRPYNFMSGEKHTTISDLFTFFINNHNAQVDVDHQFTVGFITVTDGNDYIVKADSTYLNTWESIQRKLIDSFGGYVRIRHENGINYIDYLADFTELSSQTIKLSENLLSLDKATDGSEIATAIIPLGEKDEESEERLTIKSVTYLLTTSEPADFHTNFSNYYVYAGSTYTALTSDTTWVANTYYKQIDYVYDEDAVAAYGWVFKVETWDDVTDPENLKTKAKALLAQLKQSAETIELTAADLSAIESNMGAFHLGTYVPVESDYHGIDENFLIKKLSINLLNAASNKLSIGRTRLTFTERTHSATQDIGLVGERVEKVENDYKNIQLDISQQISSAISQSSDEILTRVSEDHYLKSETDKLVSSVSTEVSQTKNEIEIRFNQFDQDIGDLQAGTDAKFQDISKYIRFVDGKIVLGVVGNELILQQQNDRISFIQSGNEVAYFSNNKLYVTDGEFLNSMKLGKFAFLPRANGNLSFVKVVD